MDGLSGRPQCKVGGCTSSNTARGWCNKHYRRWKRSGDPLKAAWERGDSASNFWAKTRRGSDSECWPWVGHVNAYGYGNFIWQGGRLAHRFAYELVIGPIPDGLDLDHTCHSSARCDSPGNSCPHRRCVNPAHLEPVTFQENARRSQPGRRPKMAGVKNLAKTHCPKRHEYTAENTYVDRRGCRNCKACRRKQAS